MCLCTHGQIISNNTQTHILNFTHTFHQSAYAGAIFTRNHPRRSVPTRITVIGLLHRNTARVNSGVNSVASAYKCDNVCISVSQSIRNR